MNGPTTSAGRLQKLPVVYCCTAAFRRAQFESAEKRHVSPQQARYLSFHLPCQLDGGILPFLEGPLPPVGVAHLELPSVESLRIHLHSRGAVRARARGVVDAYQTKQPGGTFKSFARIDCQTEDASQGKTVDSRPLYPPRASKKHKNFLSTTNKVMKTTARFASTEGKLAFTKSTRCELFYVCKDHSLGATCLRCCWGKSRKNKPFHRKSAAYH